MADAQGVNKVYYEEFLRMAKGKALSPIGIAYPPSIPLLLKKNIRFDNMLGKQFPNLEKKFNNMKF